MLRSSTCAALLLAATGVSGSTPPDSQPATTGDLWAQFPGSTAFTQNDLLSKMATAMQPTVALNSTGTSDTYSIIMLDLSLPSSRFPANVTSTLAPGLGPDRTTRVHWWDTNVRKNADNTLTSSSNDSLIAPYNGPSPPAGDIPHTYVIYLLPGQTTELQRYKDYFSASSNNRNNFSLPNLLSSDSLSGPVAATYFRVQVTNSTQTTGTTGGSQTGSSTPSVSSPSTTNSARGSWVDSPTWWAALAGVGALAAFVM